MAAYGWSTDSTSRIEAHGKIRDHFAHPSIIQYLFHLAKFQTNSLQLTTHNSLSFSLSLSTSPDLVSILHLLTNTIFFLSILGSCDLSFHGHRTRFPLHSSLSFFSQTYTFSLPDCFCLSDFIYQPETRRQVTGG